MRDPTLGRIPNQVKKKLNKNKLTIPKVVGNMNTSMKHPSSVAGTYPTTPRSARRVCTAIAVAGLILGGQSLANAQTDNFDSYANVNDMKAAGWILSYLNPALVNPSIAGTGTGKGVRLQANPYPGAAPAAIMWYKTNEYADFYMAVDIASWPGTGKDQALVLFGRMTEASTGTVVSDQSPASAQGVICNYDASQYGESPTDRKQGQLQINMLGGGFDASTIAAADITLVPGRPYRIIFQGKGLHYTAQAYDWNDLSTPLVTLEADDTVGTATTGACGVLGFSRDGTTGTVDITIDNYYAGAAAPSVAIGSGIVHPVPGTPVVTSRVPSSRWKNFFNPATPISFTANSYSANVIDAAATKFTLNGVDISSKLTVSANGTNISASLPASVLQANNLYSAEIIVSDVGGLKKSTNTFWFDTFSDAFLLSSKVKTIEAEEYNYDYGTYQLDPIHVSGLDTNLNQVGGGQVGYYDMVGHAGIDYSNRNVNPDFSFSKFRTADPVRSLSGGLIGIEDGNHPTEFDPGSDNVRSRYAAAGLLEYVICRSEPNEWLNYTRIFAPGTYTAFLRYSSFGTTTNELHRVTSDPTQPDQTSVKLGTFSLANNFRHPNYLYTPLLDDSGEPVLLNLSGTNTIRLAIAGTPGQDVRKAMQNYIMFVQTSVAVLSSATVDGTYSAEAGANVNMAARTITLTSSGSSRYYRLGSSVPLKIKSVSLSGSTVTLTF